MSKPAEAERPDARLAVDVSPLARQMFLVEMRRALESLRGVSKALARQDTADVAKAARGSGAQIEAGSRPLLDKPPDSFRVFLRNVRQGFLGIAPTAC